MTEPSNTNKRYGKLIGASLGPGDPELITRRAWQRCNPVPAGFIRSRRPKNRPTP